MKRRLFMSLAAGLLISPFMPKVEQADVAVKRTEAMSKYVAGGVEAIMEPVDFLHRVLGFTEEEAI